MLGLGMYSNQFRKALQSESAIFWKSSSQFRALELYLKNLNLKLRS